MVSYMKKSFAGLVGYGNLDLLPPAEYIAEIPHHEEEDVDDCTGCANPCSEHNAYPSYLNIEQDIPMLGSVKPYGRHILIATGLSDWPHKFQKIKGTFANKLRTAQSNHPTKQPWKNLVTNSSLVTLYSTEPESCDVMLFPDNVIISNVTVDSGDDFYDLFLAAPLPTEPMDIDLMMRDDRLGQMKIHKNPYKNVLMLCSHKKTDKRCGITAPILAKELDHVFREKDMSEYDAVVLMVSYIGGHQLAGNVICYINDGTKGIWYGRVKSCHCRAIVEETIIKGKVIKDIYRGSMENSFQNQAKRSFLGW